MEKEGVIKFSAEHSRKALRKDRFAEAADDLSSWREILVRLDVVGADPHRYDGAGFGNVSVRVPPYSADRGRRRFLISGSQTGDLRVMGLSHYCVVHAYDSRLNRVVSEGAVLPSSESLTHGAVFDLNPAIRFVFHGHVPVIWQQAKALRLPMTDPGVPYGTAAMAQEVSGLYRTSSLADKRLFVMTGHEDGVVAFGKTGAEAAQVLMFELARAIREQNRTACD